MGVMPNEGLKEDNLFFNKGIKPKIIPSDWKKRLKNELITRGYSSKTNSMYTYYAQRFISSGMEFREFLLYLSETKKSKATIRTAGFAIKFFLRFFYKNNQEMLTTIHMTPVSKNEKRLPAILSKTEIMNMVNVTRNSMHKLIIVMLYGTGMRMSELLHLRFEDINFSRKTIHIKRGKGAKDRVVMLSPQLKKLLMQLPQQKGLVFLSNRGKQYSARSIQMVVENAGRKANIAVKTHPHMLRHAFATHLLERGVDIRYIRDLLGHSRVSTTMVYTKVSKKNISKIKSPLDD